MIYGLSWRKIAFGHLWNNSRMIFTCDFTCENHWGIPSLVTKMSLLTASHTITLECPEAPTAAWGPLWGQFLAQQGATLMAQATQWDTSSNEPWRAVSHWHCWMRANLNVCELTSLSRHSGWATWAGPGAGHSTEWAGAWDNGSISPPDRRKATFLRPPASGRFQRNALSGLTLFHDFHKKNMLKYLNLF